MPDTHIFLINTNRVYLGWLGYRGDWKWGVFLTNDAFDLYLGPLGFCVYWGERMW